MPTDDRKYVRAVPHAPVMPSRVIPDDTTGTHLFLNLGAQPQRLSRAETEMLDRGKHLFPDTASLIPDRIV